MEPKINENGKRAMFIKGSKASSVVSLALQELAAIKNPMVVKYNNKRKNVLPTPFESETSLEFYSNKSDCSLFVYGSHSKKRPHNLVFGRMFNHHLLDMVELEISQMNSLENFKNQKNAIGSKPCFIITGPEFDNDETFKMIGNLFVDFFRGEVVKGINLMGLDHVIGLASNGKNAFYFRHYGVKLKKSGSKVPNVELEEIGPSFEFKIRRTKFADSDARKRTYPPKKGKKKNISNNELKDRVAKIHLGKQNIDDITKTVKKPKALRNKRKREDIEDNNVNKGGDNEEVDNEGGENTAHVKKKRKLSEPVDI